MTRPQGANCDIGAVELVQIPSQLIETIIGFFDQGVANGDITGIGPGKSAKNRPNALREQLLTVGTFIDQSNIPQACGQLKASLKRINIGGPTTPSQFVTGTAASNLVRMIQDLRQELGCNQAD